MSNWYTAVEAAPMFTPGLSPRTLRKRAERNAGDGERLGTTVRNGQEVTTFSVPFLREIAAELQRNFTEPERLGKGTEDGGTGTEPLPRAQKRKSARHGTDGNEAERDALLSHIESLKRELDRVHCEHERTQTILAGMTRNTQEWQDRAIAAERQLYQIQATQPARNGTEDPPEPEPVTSGSPHSDVSAKEDEVPVRKPPWWERLTGKRERPGSM